MQQNAGPTTVTQPAGQPNATVQQPHTHKGNNTLIPLTTPTPSRKIWPKRNGHKILAIY